MRRLAAETAVWNIVKPFRFIVLALVATAAMAAVATPVAAQFRGQEPKEPTIAEKIQAPSSSLLGLFSSDRFHMTHSVSMSYLSLGGRGAGMGMYTNSMELTIADPLRFSADVSYLFSPKGSSLFGGNQLSTFFVQRAQLDYRPSDDVLISLQYRQIPYDAYLNPYYSPYTTPYGGSPYGSFTRGSLLFGTPGLTTNP
jgi:hypothetical protein